MGEIMVSKYGHLMLPGVFPDKITPEIDFTDEAVVQCDVPVITNTFWCEQLCNVYWHGFVYSFNFLRIWSM